MPAARVCKCLLFLVYPEKVREYESLPTLEELSGYILLPRSEHDSLLSKFSEKIKPIGKKKLPPPLITAISNDQVEIVKFCIDLECLYSSKNRLIIAKLDEYSNKRLKMLPSRHCGLKLSIFSNNVKARKPKSVFQEEDCLRTMLQVVSIKADIPCRGEVNGIFLHLAVSERCEPLVRSLLENGATANAISRENETALQIVLKSKPSSESILHLLLQHGADASATGTNEPPLLLALRNSSISLAALKLLLDYGANVEAGGPELLLKAARRGSEALTCVLRSSPTLSDAIKRATLKRWVKECTGSPHEERKEILDIFFHYGFDVFPEYAADTKILFELIKLGNFKMVEKLLKWGASVSKQLRGSTTLHVAVQYAEENLLRLLIDNGADINWTNSRGVTPLSLVLGIENEEIKKCRPTQSRNVHYLVENRITSCWSYKSVKLVRTLLEAGANVNCSDERGLTPIMRASDSRNVEVMEDLLRHGAQIDVDDEWFCVDLRTAVHYGDLSAVKLYLQNGGLMEAFKMAITSRNQAMVRFLIEFDDPRAKMLEDVTTLKDAIYNSSASICEDVLQYCCMSLRSIFAGNIGHYRNNSIITRGHPLFTVIRRHVSALIAARLSINQDGNDYELPEEWKFRKGDPDEEMPRDFEAEVLAMRNTKIGDSDVSFYDILNSSVPRIVGFLRNDNIVGTLEDNNFGADFPSYAGMIQKRFRKANFRKTLVERGVKMLDFLCGHLPTAACRPYAELPYEVKEKIIDYLSNQDLLVLTNVYKLPPEEVVRSQPQNEE